MPTHWREVFPGQEYKFPDGRIWRVGGVVWDGMERHTLLYRESENITMHIPAMDLVRQATRV